MSIGGATRFGDIFQPLQAAGKEIQTGTSPCVGMVGATLGGGIGRYNGLHGLIADALISLTVITAAGEVINVSEHENGDLFWGMKGAGFNFGVVVEATYKIYDQTATEVMNADYALPFSAGADIITFLSESAPDQDAKLAPITQLSYSPEFGGVSLRPTRHFPFRLSNFSNKTPFFGASFLGILPFQRRLRRAHVRWSQTYRTSSVESQTSQGESLYRQMG